MTSSSPSSALSMRGGGGVIVEFFLFLSYGHFSCISSAIVSVFFLLFVLSIFLSIHTSLPVVGSYSRRGNTSR